MHQGPSRKWKLLSDDQGLKLCKRHENGDKTEELISLVEYDSELKTLQWSTAILEVVNDQR